MGGEFSGTFFARVSVSYFLSVDVRERRFRTVAGRRSSSRVCQSKMCLAHQLFRASKKKPTEREGHSIICTVQYFRVSLFFL
jgi:hypothetical protein